MDSWRHQQCLTVRMVSLQLPTIPGQTSSNPDVAENLALFHPSTLHHGSHLVYSVLQAIWEEANENTNGPNDDSDPKALTVYLPFLLPCCMGAVGEGRVVGAQVYGLKV
ncbi:hypothetical protein E2C01_028408 [Portunus trituberculatus]|uniref:Uncharacterized protein n=1 Tax=Portunus trituberculatus TaxID=210409 RepID=A0A5B7ELA3_PORTR|nr:hypothetical protein [Portunus trituberculatus]